MDKLEIKQKAYELNLDRIYEGYHCCEVIVYAETRGKAKQKISGEIDISDYKIDIFENEMTFLNMPIRRAKQYDKVIYKGKELRRNQVEYNIRVEKENQRIEAFLSDDKITHCYIGKRGTYYAWNYCGYTEYSFYAGVYTKEEAVPYCKNSLELTCIPIDNAKHNEKILSQITRLKKGIINN